MTNYDVFISCKSEDYSLAEDVYSYLMDHHINTFLASKELRKLGDSEYREAIEDALESAEHLIILASKPEYIKSKWVKYEWGLFLNARIDGYKEGNIITILNGIEPKDISFALRRYESFPYSHFKNSIINYVETKASILRAKEAQEKEAQKLAKQREEEEKKKRIEKTKAELIQLAEDFKKGISGLDLIKAKIESNKRLIGIKQYICPVCYAENSIDSNFCHTCGWIFSPIEGIEGAEYLITGNQKAADHYQKIFRVYSQASNHTKEIEDLNSTITSLVDKNNRMSEESEYLKLENDDLNSNISNLNGIVAKKDSQISELTISIRDLGEELSKREDELKERENKVSNLNAEIRQIKKNSEDLTATLKREIKELKNRLLSVEKSSADNSSHTVDLNSTVSSDNTQGVYSVWITFAIRDVEEIVRMYNKSFSGFEINNDGKIKNPTNKLVASFNSKKDAEELKNKLECKGATVAIKLNGQKLKPAINKTPTTRRPQSSNSEDTSPKPQLFDNTSRFGIIVKHCGINKVKVAQMLSREYGKPSNSFKNQLKELPVKTAPVLTRKRAEDLSKRLEQLGATVELWEHL